MASLGSKELTLYVHPYEPREYPYKLMGFYMEVALYRYVSTWFKLFPIGSV